MSKELDYLFAQMSNGCYDNPPRAISGWSAQPYADNKTGFAATVYQRNGSDEIIIAYRGTDDRKDALRADVAFANPRPDWDPQCSQALLLAEQVKKAHPDATISVTGHSLGGGLAQVVSQAYGFHGITFDPAGAKNIVESKEFAQFTTSHGLPAAGRGVPSNFENHLVFKSDVSSLSGAHLGRTDIITGLGNISAVEKIKLGGAHVGGVGGGVVGKVGDHVYELSLRHSMDRIENDMRDKVKGIIHPIVQNTGSDLEATKVASQTLTPRDSAHPDNAHFVSALDTLTAFNHRKGIPDGEHTINAAAGILVESVAIGNTKVEGVFAKDGQFNFAQMQNGILKTGSVDIAVATTPAELSFAKLPQAHEQHAQAVALDEAPKLNKQQSSPSMT